MKLVSKEIFPTEARDTLVEKLGGIDNGVCDIRAALEWAEEKCLELDKEKEDCLKRIIGAIGQLKWGHLKNESHDKLTSDQQIADSIYDVVIALIETQITNDQS